MATEKRLIDANAVLAKQFTSGLSDASGNYYGYADVVFVNDIENAPTVDAVEVVHCCQCKYHKMCEDGTVFCKFHSEQGERDSRSGLYSVWMEPDDFCSYGERREGE